MKQVIKVMVLEKIQKVKKLLAGIDIGSTTTKIVAVAPESGEIVYSDYKRHNAAQVQSVKKALERLALHFPAAKIRLCLTGSGAKLLAERLKIPFVQEVVANSIALRQQCDEVGTAIELGGQDAKIIFFKKDETTGQSVVSDMRMNGSCAGGTGAFIDEVASILKTPIEEFDARASRGKCVYDISGRCGVYAKTDIQPLLNQGVSRADLALSAFHAIAKQTIGGLAQGLDIEKPVAFEGGPLTFNPTLVEVFKERLQLSEEDVIIPKRPEIMIAYGAAISLNSISKQEELTVELTVEELLQRIERAEAEMKLEKMGNMRQHRSFLLRKRNRSFWNATVFQNITGSSRKKGKWSVLTLVLTPAVPPQSLC